MYINFQKKQFIKQTLHGYSFSRIQNLCKIYNLSAEHHHNKPNKPTALNWQFVALPTDSVPYQSVKHVSRPRNLVQIALENLSPPPLKARPSGTYWLSMMLRYRRCFSAHSDSLLILVWTSSHRIARSDYNRDRVCSWNRSLSGIFQKAKFMMWSVFSVLH